MISDKELVCVGIPVYNGEEFLREVFDSMIAQTYQNWECHIVNNASTDNTEKIAQEYCQKDKRFRLHNYTDFYPIVDNWNRTVNHIPEQAKYFKVLQADDWLDPVYLEEMVGLMEKHPSIGMCSSYRLDDTRVLCDGLDINDGQFYKGKELLMRHIFEEVDITGSATTLLFKVEYLKKVPDYPQIFDPVDFHCDTQLAFHMMNIADVGFVFKILSYTRWHKGALTSQICVKYNTFFNSREIRLFKFKDVDEKVFKEYKKHRLIYAYYLLKKSLFGNKKLLEWHRKRLERKFTFGETLKAIAVCNGISYRIGRIFKKH